MMAEYHILRILARERVSIFFYAASTMLRNSFVEDNVTYSKYCRFIILGTLGVAGNPDQTQPD